MFKDIVQFIKSKAFFKNLAIFVILFSLVCWITLRWLASYTNHGETVTVPDFSGLKIDKLDQFIEGKQVQYQIIDSSIYDPKAAKGIVVRQEPDPKALVKEDRTIYLYVTSTLPPRILMPKLIDRSLRQATAMIVSYGMKVGKITHTPDECSNCVLEQLSKGRKLEPGKPVPKGTVVDLVIGQGLDNEEVEVPCLIGLTVKEAERVLIENALLLGETVFENDKDSLISKVYDQTPSCEKENVSKGASIDLYLTTNKSKILPPGEPKKKLNEDFD
ncbi:MAG TPA: PASTA domain-containing protein [Bacteroidia bacterium]|jgi:beta-lactam-binding protein with PASTA domain|nr:PASTA domain-containing protein [Bacteroidia bacterium]